jgi:hypothetical protein
MECCICLTEDTSVITNSKCSHKDALCSTCYLSIIRVDPNIDPTCPLCRTSLVDVKCANFDANKGIQILVPFDEAKSAQLMELFKKTLVSGYIQTISIRDIFDKLNYDYCQKNQNDFLPQILFSPEQTSSLLKQIADFRFVSLPDGHRLIQCLIMMCSTPWKLGKDLCSKYYMPKIPNLNRMIKTILENHRKLVSLYHISQQLFIVKSIAEGNIEIHDI